MRISTVVLALVLSAVPASAQREPVLHVFAPGVISGRDVFGVTFTRDGKTVFFCETNPGTIEHVQIMESHLRNGKWSDPKPAPFSDGTVRDVDPSITPDGKHLIFESTRPWPGRDATRTDFDAYIMDWTKQGWSNLRPLAEINTEATEMFVVRAKSGTLYFSSDRPGGLGKLDFYVLPATKGSQPGNVAPLNTPENDSNVAVAPDESFMVLGHMGHLYLSRREGESWSAPAKLTRITVEDHIEYAPWLSRDGKTLYFTRTKFEKGKRLEPGTIYYVKLAEVIEAKK